MCSSSTTIVIGQRATYTGYICDLMFYTLFMRDFSQFLFVAQCKPLACEQCNNGSHGSLPTATGSRVFALLFANYSVQAFHQHVWATDTWYVLIKVTRPSRRNVAIDI